MEIKYAHSHTVFVLNMSGSLDTDYIYKQHQTISRNNEFCCVWRETWSIVYNSDERQFWKG